MGYIDNKLVTIDAVVTERGRELLSQGRGKFKVSQFAVADDGVDYRLWDINNTNGSIYYGEVIEKMSLPEANPNQDKTMNFKILNLPKNIEKVPVIGIGGGNLNPIIQATYYLDNLPSPTEWPAAPFTLLPVTYNPSNANSVLGYTATVSNVDVLQIKPFGTNAQGGNLFWSGTSYINEGDFIFDNITGFKTVKAIGTYFEINLTDWFYNGSGGATASVTIEGNETGGKLVVNFTILERQI